MAGEGAKVPGGKKTFSLATKLMFAFLALSLVAFACIGYLSIYTMNGIEATAEENSGMLGKLAVNDSITALQQLGESAIKEKALDVAEEVRIFLESHPGLSGEAMGKDPELVKIAIQPVGKTGYTCVYEKGTALMRLHPNAQYVNFDMRNLQERLPSWWKIYEPSLSGSVSGGYYDWLEADGSIRQKFMYMVPVGGTGYMVAATTYIDEFTAPARETEQSIAAATRSASDSISNEIERTKMLFAFIFFAILFGVACMVLLISRTITGPIRTLTEGTEIIGAGNLDHRVNIHSGDEIEQLAAAINRMAGDLKDYMEKIVFAGAEKERIEKELDIARGIQQSFLPDRPPEIEGMDLAALSLPAREVGGDFYDFIPLPNGKWGLVIADVAGKGVPAAMFMGISRTLVRSNAATHSSVAGTICHANDIIADSDHSSMFVTLFYGVLDTKEKTLTYVSAGHNYPMMLKDGSIDTILLKAEGIALGVQQHITLEER
ncbi:MAG: SpoIIE family protein phosphatase, partial [Methanoregulaceae archaeon]|nr:SpoIIE family protein phosphatase [Methanoregulaceae archaeon]